MTFKPIAYAVGGVLALGLMVLSQVSRAMEPELVIETCKTDEIACRKMADQGDNLALIGMGKRLALAGNMQDATSYFVNAQQKNNLYALAWLFSNNQVTSQKLYYAQQMGRHSLLIQALPFMLQAGLLPSQGGDMTVNNYLKPPRIYTECLKGLAFCRAAAPENPSFAMMMQGVLQERQGASLDAELSYRQSNHPFALWRLSKIANDTSLSELQRQAQKNAYAQRFRAHADWADLQSFIE